MSNTKILTLSSFFILLFWSFLVPTFEFPDEQAHFSSVAYISENGDMPEGNIYDTSEEIVATQKILGTFRDSKGNNKLTYHPEYKIDYSNEVYGIHEQNILDKNNHTDRSNYVKKEAARYPFLYYLYESIFYRSVANYSIFTRLFLARFGSVLLGVLNVWVAIMIGEEIFEKNKNAILLGSLVALQPMMSFIMSGVNSDVLHNLIFSFIMLFSLRFIKYEFVGDVAFYLGVFLGLDFLTKPQAYIAIPIIFIAIIIRTIVQKKIASTLRSIAILGLIALIGGFATQGQNFINFFTKGIIPYLNTDIHPNAPSFIEHTKYSVNRLFRQNTVWYWGVFKWLGVVLPPIFWQIANRLVGISIIGLIVGIVRKKYKSDKISQISLLVSSSILYLLIIFWRDWQTIRATSIQIGIQARYYFPMFTSHMAILIMGISGFFKNKKFSQTAKTLLLAFFVALQLVGIYTIAKSYYDTSSISTLFIQASQYKPMLAKGAMWYALTSLYLIGIIGIISANFKEAQRENIV